MNTEADTCRKFVVPRLQAAGWDAEPCSIAEQRSITDGRIVPRGSGFIRKPPKRVDYLLRYRRDFPLAVVEAKATYKSAADGVQQARQYAEMLDLKFAYATNGREIIEIDYLTGRETLIFDYPTPQALWRRYEAGTGVTPNAMEQLLAPYNHEVGKGERYYQQTAINRVIEALVKGQRRVLVNMATGTGKTPVAFQICWKLWTSRWNRTGEHRKPRILYLADRNILIDQPKDGIFAAFGDARYKIESGAIVKSREIYFTIYQALAEDERRQGLFRQYPADFFDLVIVDECHRGSAREDSAWREILDYFEPAYKLGMTATPLRDESRNTYRYFGVPVCTYSLRQGIEDGFLAPYRVHRVITEWDAAGWRPSQDDLDRYGRQIPDDEYATQDFERIVALRARTEAIAKHLTEFMKKADRFAKTIVFCVDQEHASEMRRALYNLNSDLTSRLADYVCRVTSDEGDIGRGHLSRFQDVDAETPVILTTSQLLTTGVDAPTCKNIVIARIVGSMSEFKQIIGRGTRVRDDYGKLWFNIIDYTGTATRMFADPEFDGEATLTTETKLDEPPPQALESCEPSAVDGEERSGGSDEIVLQPPPPDQRRKFYFDGGRVEIAAHLVYELDPDGRQLSVVRYTDYAAGKVRSLVSSSQTLREVWTDPSRRESLIEQLGERGISFEELGVQAKQPDADPFDLLCHLAFNAPLRTRRERARQLKTANPTFFDRYQPKARAVLEDLLEKYAEFGEAQFTLPDILKVPPLSKYGQPGEIIQLFGGAEQLREAVTTLQVALYAA